jgi:cellulose synthase operon protein C
LKSSRDSSPSPGIRLFVALLALISAGWSIAANGALPAWISNIESGTALEKVFFRLMALPAGEVTFRRPPSETRPALSELILRAPANAELYSLRALEDEQQLDFAAAESDWKLFVEKSAARPAAQLSLADFYHRRLRPLDEIAVLNSLATAPPDDAEDRIPALQQTSWRAFERIFRIIHAQALPKDVSVTKYRAWIARYPAQPQLYSRFLDFLLAQMDYSTANQLIEDYQRQFPGDIIFQVKAKALVDYRQGSIQQGLAVYEKSFQPLWDPELVKSYFDLLGQTQNLRKFLDESHAALNTNPEDLNATAEMFYYYQQQGKLDAAQQAITSLRLQKDSSHSTWTSEELYTCGRLLEGIHSYPEAARYYFALYNSTGADNPQERALSRLIDILLTAPEARIRLGAGDLSIYKDIATLDQGPGYLNGILSLILNTTSPASEYAAEEQKAVSYFNRSRAAELVTLLDKNYPNSTSRPELHAKLLDFYAASAKSEAVLKSGAEFLATFPAADQRTTVALLMADADAHLNKTQEEFAIYDSVLRELATKAGQVPLGLQFTEGAASSSGNDSTDAPEEFNNEGEENAPSQQLQTNAAFQLNSTTVAVESEARSPEYSRVLERYLARLVELKQIPQALGVLRREIDHNPNDPGLYERLAAFLEQNRLGTEQEEIYRRAIARFPDRSWYQKLARYYLRYKRNSDFEALTQEAVQQFDGSDLQNYFQAAVNGTPEMYLRLNEYANKKFPHSPYFVRNLLAAYRSPHTRNLQAWEALLRQHWFEQPDLRNEFFEYLSSSGKLDSELSALQRTYPSKENGNWDESVRGNPAAGQYIAQAEIWRSHFEESTSPLQSLAKNYPADFELGRTASSVFRSLAYFDPADTDIAVKIEANLLAVNPGNTEILDRLGDVYSDRELFAKAAPYWERIPKVAAGESAGYLEAASIYWDYFDFDNALRILAEGRKKLGDDTLYGYEIGAICEGKRDYTRAIHEYAQSALAADADSPALSRLLALGRRPQYRDVVNQETSKIVSTAHYSTPSVHLRVRVLQAENRKPELIELLDAAAANSTSLEQAAEIETLAQQNSLEDVRQRALEKQASLATDPVTRLQLRYSIVRFYEARRDFAAAQQNIEALYKENPAILGVVRSTVDFYWSVKRYPQAIAVLQQSAKRAYPELGKQFTFEAAQKSTLSHQYQQAREMLDALLKDSPYDAQYLAAMADAYAQSGDQQGLKQFYLDKIALFRSAPLSSDDRKTRIAALRRGLIPALTQLGDYSGAVDQYIELINSFPEDESLVSEAAFYSLRYKRQPQLLDFYAKTVQESPRDFRWPLVLARSQASLENFPAAIDAYGKAIAVRPDRTDLRMARAALAERLVRYDDAVADYERLYQFTYKDPQWMVKIAEDRARQGRSADAIAALKTALIDAAPDRAENYFEVARRLEAWGILEPERGFAEQGVHAAGSDLLASPEFHDDAKLYARLMTRLRRQDEAYSTLRAAVTAASSSLPVVKQQVAKEGIAAVTDKEWRERTLKNRIDNARNGLQGALIEMGATVALYFTPEEKVSFALFAQKLRDPMRAEEANLYAFPLVHSAGLAELEARWRYEWMMSAPERSDLIFSQFSNFNDLQRQRPKFADLGPQLESIAIRVRPEQQATVYLAAAEAFRSAGDSENELRVLTRLFPANVNGDTRARFFALLLEEHPEQFVQIASQWTPYGQEAADYAVGHGSVAIVDAVVAARGRSQKPVWRKSYASLVGMYFAQSNSAVNAAFLDALGDQNIGERLGHPVNRDDQLAGDVWFYYGSRYGEYLHATKLGNPDDYLPSALEQSPASPSGYRSLADFYFGAGDTRSAITEYLHALELSPDSLAIYDRLALAYYKQGNRAEAIAEWKKFFSEELKFLNRARPSESFWADFGAACDHLKSRHLFAAVKPEVDALVRAYLHQNGNYRSNALLHSAYSAIDDPAAATAWLLEVSTSAPDPTLVLSDVVQSSWIPLGNREPIYRRILEAKQEAVAKAEGLDKENLQAALREWQIHWVQYLFDTRQFMQAADFLATLPIDAQNSDRSIFASLELRAAAQLGTLDAKIVGYRAHPESAPASDSLRRAAQQLLDAGDNQSARKILEFVFTRELDGHQLVAANFLGLAEVRIAASDIAAAMDILRRLVLVVGDPYQNMDSAAALLEKTGHSAEAIQFLEPLAKSTPWQPAFRLRIAKAQIAAHLDASAARRSLTTIAASAENSYGLRVESALALSPTTLAENLGGAELMLLAGNPKSITPAQAFQPYFYDAPLKLAQNESDLHAKVNTLSKALAETPARDDARIPLFQAAAQLHYDTLALAAIEKILQGDRLRQFAGNAAQADEQNIDSEEIADKSDTEPATWGSPNTVQSSQRAQLARSVGIVLLRLNRFSEALGYLQAARRLEKTPAVRNAIASEIANVSAILRRERTNSARQPILHADLEQDRLVRPRLLARTAPVTKHSVVSEEKP